MKKQKIELTPKQRKKKIILRILLFIFLYFTVFKLAKLQFDKAIIVSMPNLCNKKSSRSEYIPLIKAWFISAKNIDATQSYFRGSIIEYDNPKAIQIVASKGGNFNISHIESAYYCGNTNSVKFLEEWMAIDKYSQDDIYIAQNFLLRPGINVAPFKLLLDIHPELKQYDELRQIILLKLNEYRESLDSTSYDYEERLEKYKYYQEALAYFDS